MMPVGAIIARYLRVAKSANPAWFYIHVFCQASAYIIGVAGWATGLKLGGDSPGIQYSTHRSIGIALFSLATVQVYNTHVYIQKKTSNLKRSKLDHFLCYMSGFCDVSEAETRAQAQALLEHIPPLDRLHVDHPGGGERV